MAEPSIPDPEQARVWMAQWRSAGKALERIKAAELATVDIRVVAMQLEDASRAALASRRPRPTSGLVEQQRILHRRAKT